MSDDVAIKVEHLTKMYKLYEKPSDRLKDSLGLSKQKMYQEHYALSDINMEVKEERRLESLEQMVQVNPQY